jgi:drug/metabolite transporter (DMT)-like permease
LRRLRGVSWSVYVFGTAGLFGYHFLYFTALRLAPPAEAGLIAYHWPLLIVLFSGLLPGEHLRAGHLLGAVMGFVGEAVLILGKGNAFNPAFLSGYGLAFFVWDIGVKHGDIQLLSVASYAAPVLSTFILVMAGIAPATPTLLGAALLITGGAALAARASTAPKKG